MSSGNVAAVAAVVVFLVAVVPFALDVAVVAKGWIGCLWIADEVSYDCCCHY